MPRAHRSVAGSDHAAGDRDRRAVLEQRRAAGGRLGRDLPAPGEGVEMARARVEQAADEPRAVHMPRDAGAVERRQRRIAVVARRPVGPARERGEGSRPPRGEGESGAERAAGGVGVEALQRVAGSVPQCARVAAPDKALDPVHGRGEPGDRLAAVPARRAPPDAARLDQRDLASPPGERARREKPGQAAADDADLGGARADEPGKPRRRGAARRVETRVDAVHGGSLRRARRGWQGAASRA